jgi:transketolase
VSELENTMPSAATRDAFGKALAEIGERFPQVVALDADLAKSTKSEHFAKKFPERFFEMGIAEANMCATAAGLALAGKIPFACSFACFITGQFAEIRIAVAYSQAPVRLVGTHAGVAIGEDGHSQMGLEDIALMRTLPGMAVIQPADDLETAAAVEHLVKNVGGPAYLRLTRQKVDRVHADGYKFQFGKVDTLRAGDDVAILATGGPVKAALDAAEKLAGEGLSVRVVNVHTIKPLDADGIEKIARECGRIVTVEDHTVMAGMGGAVCEAVADRHPVPVRRLGVQDVFGESGSPEDLIKKFGLDAESIAESTRAFCRATSAAV